MLVPGPNGICAIIGCLVGLSIAADVESWSRSVRDVHWVVREQLAAVKSGARYVLYQMTANDPTLMTLHT